MSEFRFRDLEEQKDIFEKWRELGILVDMVKSIAQNDVPLSEQDIEDFKAEVDSLDHRFQALKQETLQAIKPTVPEKKVQPSTAEENSSDVNDPFRFKF